MDFASFVHRFRYGIVALWLLLAVAAVAFLPQLPSVVAHVSSTPIPVSSGSVQASNLLEQVNPQKSHKSSALIVIHRASGLTPQDLTYWKAHLSPLASHPGTHGITFLQDTFNVPSRASSAFKSHDGTTELALVGFPGSDTSQATATAYKNLQTAFKNAPAGAQVYFTGDVPIQQDSITLSLQGVARTAVVTVILVLLILVWVLRSALAPLLNLLTVGISFVISSGIVALLGQRGFPVSTFTQTFLIAILFGAGTDYSIILFNRFREELARHGGDAKTAMSITLRTVGRTVAFSSATVIVSFAVLVFTRFGLFRSAAGVSIGVAVTLLACLSFLPALMSILGTRIFWPGRVKSGHEDVRSRFWSWTGGVATDRPWATLGVLLLILLPVALLFTNLRSFDTLDEIPKAPSVIGFHVVAKSFGEGTTLPVQIVLDSSQNLRTPQGLATIDQVARILAATPGVASVDAATRPEGTVVPGFTLAGQVRSIASSMGALAQGAQQVAQGLQSVTKAAGSGPVGAALQKESQGAAQVAQGVAATQSALQASASAAQRGDPGFAVPAQTLTTNAGLKAAMNAFISPSGKVAVFDVSLSANPYSTTAIDQVPVLLSRAETALSASPVTGGRFYAGGATAQQYDLNLVSNTDFSRTVLVVLLAIFLLLILLLRSLFAPLYVLVSLVGGYFVTMGVNQVIFVDLLKKPGIEWTVPFFTLLVLVALGVDYSIFLMSRFQELLDGGASAKEAMKEAMARMGHVIFSAALILGGTFASMTASGVTGLEEIGVSVVIGLLLYAVILLALFVPAFSSLVGPWHHWPFTRPLAAKENAS